jgi:hypothetical protein
MRTVIVIMVATMALQTSIVGHPAVGGGRAVKYTPVPLVVTVYDLDSDGVPCGICSDGQGGYSDGVDGVSANIDQYGDIIINFQTTKAKIRGLHYDYSQALGGQPAGWTAPPDGPNNYFSTIAGPGAVALQTMLVGAAECLEGGPSDTFTDFNQTQYRHDFHRPLNSFDVSTTSFLVVTRTSSTIWDVEPKSADCNTGSPKVIRLFQTPTRANFSFTDDGLFYMPFKMTLQAK